jgi:hypothetical protein
MAHPRSARMRENGSVIVYVFVGIALFGALMFLFSRGASQNSTGFTKQQSTLTASDILSYRQSLETTVQKLISQGCSENEISFINDSETGYTNPNSRPDKSCDVFDAAGGRAKYVYPPVESKTTYAAGIGPGFNNYGFTGDMVVTDVGTTQPELIMWTMTNKATCDAINANLGQTTANDTFADGTIAVPYTGTFPNIGSAGVIGDEAYASALPTGCFNHSPHDGQYIFYAVLLAR